MTVVKFPKKDKCTCNYVYRLLFNPNDATFEAEIAKDIGKDKVELMASLLGFDHEIEAEAAAFGFMEALHYIRSGEKL